MAVNSQLHLIESIPGLFKMDVKLPYRQDWAVAACVAVSVTKSFDLRQLAAVVLGALKNFMVLSAQQKVQKM